MVELVFFLRFRTQLRRIRPELLPRLEDSVFRAVEEAGGKITRERRLIRAVFDEHSLGFWLDILILIETLLNTMEAYSADLYGYSLFLGRGLPYAPEVFCNFLAGGNRGGGVFLDRAAETGLLPYIVFETPAVWMRFYATEHERPPFGDLSRLNEIKIFVSTAARNRFPLRDTVAQALSEGSPGPRRAVLIIGPAFEGKREGLYRYCAELVDAGGDFSPLFIRFGGCGLNALTDAWSPRLRPSSGAADDTTKELDSLWDFLFRERLREELSAFIIRKARRFCKLLLKFYTGTAQRKKAASILVLENIHLAGDHAAGIFIEAFASIRHTRGLVVLGTCGEEIESENLRKWETVFPRLIKLNAKGIPPARQFELSPELWEIAYALSLLGRYFPSDLFIRLFEEEGKNPAVIFRALGLLSTMGVIDTPLDPCPWIEDFDERAEAALGERKEQVRALVCRRLLAWVAQKRLSPCFRLLVILADLGGSGYLTDQLILKSITSDLVNGTVAGVERARDIGLLEALVGPERSAAIRYILVTTGALLAGTEDEIRAAFRDPPPDCPSPVLRAQVLVNLSGCYLGVRDHDSAMETIKDAILSSQGKHNLCLAQAYRLFSQVSLSKQRLGETIDYLGFAVEHAEKSGNYHELGISAYYAAVAQFLFGNVSRAARLARKAREQALAAGRPEWADCSRFLEGRIAFETGRYQEALELFENILRGPSGEAVPEKERLLAAWAYRARVYFQNPLCRPSAAGGHDAALFEVEAAYLAGNYRKAADLAGALTNPHIEENFLYTEQPDWRSGFAQCELLYFSNGELWDRMICVYHSLALCRLSPAGGEEAVHNMQRVIRNEQLSEMDPWDAFYFYAWYRILEQTGASQIDMNTAVSMAFKRLQRRASRIDDVETRRQFLSQPRWNSALTLAAREYKLL